MAIEAASHDLKIRYNPEMQGIELDFKPEEFKTFEFLLAVLEMARLKAEFLRHAAMANQAQQAMMLQVQQQQLAAQQHNAINRIVKGK